MWLSDLEHKSTNWHTSTNYDWFTYSSTSSLPGQRFALMEGKVVLSSILRHFNIESIHRREEMLPSSDLVLRPSRGAWVKLSHRAWNQNNWINSLIARFMGPTWGPSGADRTQVGPILAPWTLLSGSRFAFQQRYNGMKECEYYIRRLCHQ